MFTDFLFILSIIVAALLAILLVMTARAPSRKELRRSLGPIVLVMATAGLVALGFAVM